MNLIFKTLAIFLILVPTIANADYNDWSTEKKSLWWTYNVISTIDYLQTRSALRDPCNCYEEANPLLGKNPKDETMLAVNLVTSYLIYKTLDNPNIRDRDIKALKIVTGLRLGVIVHNHHLGVRINLDF